MNPTIRKAGAVLTSFLAGPYAGQAIAEIIFGITNPSAKLPITYTNHPSTNNLNYYRLAGEIYSDIYWEFGHGLSYTTFQYSDLTLSSPTISFNTTITATVTLTNTGNIPGAEVVLFFLTDVYRSVAPEVKKLRQFHKVHLPPAKSTKVSFIITREDLAFYNASNVRVIETGTFILSLGNSNLSANFTLESSAQASSPYQPLQLVSNSQRQ
ncbi:hypothetical protein DSO57_1007626 [Entomophthora muscae]|uniref:Uncharacterized protein n=1 Tax=Entomophthora muscae TaxID=34485 RepID=A0ACC2TV05_9FUNG|nr:hypothetical protein DSO57_1007626 [Entomophthora muscae]